MRKKRDISQDVVRMKEVGKTYGERADCSVIALAIISERLWGKGDTGTGYAAAHRALAARGRKPRCGVYNPTIMAAARDMGMTLGSPVTELKSKQGNRFTTITIGRAFPQGTFLVFTYGHVSAMHNGVIRDWARDRRKPVEMLIQVEG